MTTANFAIEWHDEGREPQCAPNPNYPHGIDIDIRRGAKGCLSLLPYPAQRCGYYTVRCNTCGFAAVITTAGRPDDPISIALPCKTEKDPIE